MDEIVEGIFRSIWSVIRWLLWNIIFHVVLFNLGRLILLIITMGRYPRGQSLEKDIEKISWAGVVVVLAAWVAIALYNNYS